MRHLTYYIDTTLDGCIAAPAGGMTLARYRQ
jgi:hypothetical protein